MSRHSKRSNNSLSPIALPISGFELGAVRAFPLDRRPARTAMFISKVSESSRNRMPVCVCATANDLSKQIGSADV
jgi:hypothetical protein